LRHDLPCNVRGDDDHGLAWERACLVRLGRGDRSAFAELYRAFAPKLYREVLMPKLGHAQAAEDALAETFASLLAQHAKLELGDKGLMPWLARVAANKAIDAHRKAARGRRSLASYDALLAPLREASDASAPLELKQLREHAARRVPEVLAAINPRYRRALELRFFEEHSREQCAALLEVSVPTFDVLLLRALRAFRGEWERVLAARGQGR
jgi:RNA polymerase sigma-70 factor (ECF subfamily)